MIFIKIISFGQEYSVNIKFSIERNMISLDSTLKVFFVINGDTTYPNIKGNKFNIPKIVENKYADFYFIYKKYKLIFYSICLNDTPCKNQVWIVNIDKRPIDKIDYWYIPKKDWWRIKWIYSLVRGNSQIDQYVYWFQHR